MRVRAVSWMLLFDLVLLGRSRWGRLNKAERRMLGVLITTITKQRRVPTKAERDFLREVVIKLDLVGAGRDLLPRLGKR